MTDLERLDGLRAKAEEPMPFECLAVAGGALEWMESREQSRDLYIAALHNAYPAMAAELRRLRQVEAAARRLRAVQTDSFASLGAEAAALYSAGNALDAAIAASEADR